MVFISLSMLNDINNFMYLTGEGYATSNDGWNYTGQYS